jgi:hypothetical protein
MNKSTEAIIFSTLAMSIVIYAAYRKAWWASVLFMGIFMYLAQVFGNASDKLRSSTTSKENKE